MIAAYSEYRETNAKWLGDIPSHWQLLPNRALFGEVKERGHANAEMLSVTIDRGVIRQKELLNDTTKKDSSNEDKSKYKLVSPLDIAYNKMRAWQGAIGFSRYRGIVSPAYVVVRLRAAHLVHYFHYLFRTPRFAAEAQRWSYGISSDQWSLRWEDFKKIYSPVPPPVEQACIVNFLSQEDRKIKQLFASYRRLVGVSKSVAERKLSLINEYRTRMIVDVVTGKLDVRDAAAVLPDVDPLDEHEEAWQSEENAPVDQGNDAIPAEAEA